MFLRVLLEEVVIKQSQRLHPEGIPEKSHQQHPTSQSNLKKLKMLRHRFFWPPGRGAPVPARTEGTQSDRHSEFSRGVTHIPAISTGDKAIKHSNIPGFFLSLREAAQEKSS